MDRMNQAFTKHMQHVTILYIHVNQILSNPKRRSPDIIPAHVQEP